MPRSHAGATRRARRRAGQLSRQRAAAESRRFRPGCSTVATANGGACSQAPESAARARRSSARTRPQTGALDLHYLFAPLKHARLDYMAQKAVEMGASRLQPVLTRHAQVARVNLDRMRANAIEAAEQCGILTLPEIAAPLRARPDDRASAIAARLLVFCDEDAEVKDPVAALSQARDANRGRADPARGADRAGRRLCRGRARRAAAAAEHGAARARPAHPARRYRRGRGACAGRSGARRLAVRRRGRNDGQSAR